MRPAHLAATSTRGTSVGRSSLSLFFALMLIGATGSQLTPVSASTGTRARVVETDPGNVRPGPHAAVSATARSSTSTPTPAAPVTGCNTGWSNSSVPSLAQDNAFLNNAVAVVNSNNVWGVGAIFPSATTENTMIQHWDGTSWTNQTSIPLFGGSSELLGVSAVTATDIYAVGDITNGSGVLQTLIEHFDGTAWTVITSPNASTSGDNVLWGVSAHAGDVWAVGLWRSSNTNSPPFQTLTEHFNGTAWSVITSQNVNTGIDSNRLLDVSAVAANDVWAVGRHLPASGPSTTLIEHWDGSVWSIVASPNVGGENNVLYGVAGQSSSAAWAVGSWSIGGVARTLVLQWNGTSWSSVATPNNGSSLANYFFSVTAPAANDVWAVGAAYTMNSTTTPAYTLTEHWDGRSWAIVNSPNPNQGGFNEINGIAADSANDLWTVGDYVDGTGFDQSFSQTFCPAIPVVSSVSPSRGPTTGGTGVTITGSGFETPAGTTTRVRFGSTDVGFSDAGFVVNSDTQITTVTLPELAGPVDVQVISEGGPSALSSADTYTYVPLYVFSPQPIAPPGSLTAGSQIVSGTLIAKSFDGTVTANTAVYLSFGQATNGGTATANGTPLTVTPTAFTTDSNGQIQWTYTTPASPPATGFDIITAEDNPSSTVVTFEDSYNFAPAATFYFAEGFTASGFTEKLSLLTPSASGLATISYSTAQSKSVMLTAGKVLVEDVNADVGPNAEVSATVTLPGQGVVERILNFNFGSWYGSTDKVGATQPATEWDLAEGSTLPFFNEYLTLQNPNGYLVVVDLNYVTDSGAHPIRTVVLGPNSRTTVEVFSGDTTTPSPPPVSPNTRLYGGCVPNGAGANCGVGRGLGGVSVSAVSRTLPIIVERPFYVNGFSFGSGGIRDGHDAFGANAPNTTWNFAEGTTIAGFNEYLTLQNPGAVMATVALNYVDDHGTTLVRTLTINAQSRVTVEVFSGNKTAPSVNPCTPNGTGANCGVGPGVGGVSVQVVSTQPIVAERPIYVVHNFGTGSVAGAHVVVGSTVLGKLFGFAAASTLTGDNDFLTIQNPASAAAAANVTLTYYTNAGPVTKKFTVPIGTRVTVEVFHGDLTNNNACSPSAGTCGVGSNVSPLGIVLASDQPVLVEKPTYSSNSGSYGATDTLGYSPPTGAF